MIVNDSYFRRSGIRPSKDDTPLVVDPDRVKARQIAPESLQTVPRWNSEIAECASLIHLFQFSQCNARYSCKLSQVLLILILFMIFSANTLKSRRASFAAAA